MLAGMNISAPVNARDQVFTSPTSAPTNFRITLPLLYEGAYQGDVPVIVTSNGRVSVDLERFIALLGPRLSPALIFKIKDAASSDSTVALDNLNVIGISAAYDPAKLELRISIPVSQQGARSVSAYERTQNATPNPRQANTRTIRRSVAPESANRLLRQTNCRWPS